MLDALFTKAAGFTALAYCKSGTQDRKVEHGTKDSQVEPYGGILMWNPRVGPGPHVPH